MEVLTLFVAGLALVAVIIGYFVFLRRNAEKNKDTGELTDASTAVAQQVAVALDAQMRKLAAEVLTQNNEQFLTLATERLSTVQEQTKGLLEPFAEQMTQLGKTVGELRSAHEEGKGAVQAFTTRMGQQINELSTSTLALSEALRSPTARGAWGENQLRNVIDLAGMTPYCDYEEQVTGENREGISGRPDVRVRLPNGAYLAVDAKVPLDAYLDAQATTDPNEVESHLARHAAALRGHVNSLASRKYWEQNNNPAPEFVVLFVPGESFLADALRSDTTLLQDAMQKQVLLASPVNLLALLWSVARGWQEARITDHARDVAQLGEELYERMGVVLGHIRKTGRGLGSAVTAFNDLVGSVDGRLLVTLRRFPDLGVGSGDIDPVSEIDSLPRYLQGDEIDELEESDG